ncbi:MAG: ribonuclease PH [Devosiaceae bacterium]|nr:ribonuclease PH [Devosiaceae bacterium]
MRPSKRQLNEMRNVTIERNIAPQAEGSCLISFGNTKVLCTASVETKLPPWRRGQGVGWVTAEYGMLPRSTGSRMRREATQGKQSGRTQEIQRLIGRSMRAIIDMEALGENQITLDCDVIQADGGTRTAAISGAYVALSEAISWMRAREIIKKNPIKDNIAAISCGIYQGSPVLDLDYIEDSEAETDANFVMSGSGKIIEIQGTAEQNPFSRDELNQLLDLAQKGIGEIITIQNEALAK